MGTRAFKPLVLETKQQLRNALKSGQLQCTKYNLLDDDEKLFVEMLVFGDYTGEQAMRCIKPTLRDARAAGNRMMANPNVADALQELSVQRDKKFMAELMGARDMAMNKLKYIMATSTDEAVVVTCAKIILERGEKIILDNTKKDLDRPTGIVFNIKVDNASINPRKEADIIEGETIEVEVDEHNEEQPEHMAAQLSEVGPNGLPFTISYEGVDNYKK